MTAETPAAQLLRLGDLVTAWTADVEALDALRASGTAEITARLEGATNAHETRLAQREREIFADACRKFDGERARLAVARAGIDRYGLAVAMAHANHQATRPVARA